jgi:type III secretion system YscQ/HrcQ family protein
MVKRIRWDGLAKVGRHQASLLTWAAAKARRARPGTEAWQKVETALGLPLDLTWGEVSVVARRDFGARLTSTVPWVAVCGKDLAEAPFAVVIDGALAGRIAARVFGAPEGEFPAPRAATLAEKGVLLYVVAAALDARGLERWRVDGTITDPEPLAALWPTESVLEQRAQVRLGAVSGQVRLCFSEPAWPVSWPPGSLAAVWPEVSARLSRISVRARVIAGSARVATRDLAALAPRDVVLLQRFGPQPTDVFLCVGPGGFSSTLDAQAGTLTISHPYEQGDSMSALPDESLVGDLPVELTCQLAHLTLSARELCELAPGAVLPLGRPVGTTAVLCAGGRTIARGELVDVEGELGLRVLEMGEAR